MYRSSAWVEVLVMNRAPDEMRDVTHTCNASFGAYMGNRPCSACTLCTRQLTVPNVFAWRPKARGAFIRENIERGQAPTRR